ncbi:hypothetical protein PLICRDRAFT_127694 [Plicaturopsis crispa FD-325 SS-3]|nr:hypothetical protein PLICRDRAFT_127694 [Plicaturopsis crispa FD-325 SS-3]
MKWCALCAFLPILGLVSLANAAPTDIPSAASFYVPRLPDLHQDEAHPLHIYSGHISSDPKASSASSTDVTAHIFFAMIKARRTADKERLMFWFNGGPGCSSFDGLMMEVGPWRIDGQGGLKTVEGGWEEYTTMVYVDQPAGTGFSYTSTDKYVHGLTQASEQFIEFLTTFYKIFPEYLSVDTYLGGESFAGQFIPYFANAILESNLKAPLRGIAIGNGWIDGRNQYPSFIDYGVKHGLVEENSDLYKKARTATDECMAELKAIEGPGPIATEKCERLLPMVLSGKSRTVDGQKMCVNIYDVRLEDTSPACGMNWPPDLKDITKYLGRSDVVNALHASAKSTSWTECQGTIHQAFNDATSVPSITLFPKLLQQIPILLFAGDQDFICNYVGIEALVQDLTWNGEKGLGKVQTQSWNVNNTPAGTWVSSRNLTYVKMFNASHMVPYDVPHVAHDMILRFMGANFSAIADGSARIPSSVGESTKPIFVEDTHTDDTPTVPPAKTPEQDKAMWEAYYNAGSAALVLVLIFLVLGVCFWCRVRRRRLRGLQLNPNEEEESIPLNSSRDGADDGFRMRGNGNGKGKERAVESLEPPIFDVGEHSDDEDGYKSDGSHRSR